MNGNRGVCRRLLALGADTSAVDARGRTALDLALRYNHSALADYLRLKGARYGGGEGRPRRPGFESRRGRSGRDERRERRGVGAAHRRGGVPRGTEGGATRDELGARRAGDVGGEKVRTTATTSRRGEERRRGETDVDDAASYGSDPPPSDEGPLLSPE